MYLTIFEIVGWTVLFILMVLPFFKKPFVAIGGKLEYTILGDIMEVMQEKLDDGFDDGFDVLSFVGLYFLYALFALTISLIIGIIWLVFLPIIALTALLYFLKKKK